MGIKRIATWLFITAWVLTVMATPGFGLMSEQINYQGKLTDPSGMPVLDDTYIITFSIYNSDTATIPLWHEASVAVPVVNGIFNVKLPHDPGSSPFPAGLFDNELFLGVKVGADDEMVPRQLLTSVPFAFKAADSQMLEGRLADEFAGAEHTHDFADINGSVSDDQVPDTITVNHAAQADLAENADLLDGQPASFFAAATHEHTFAQILGEIGDGQVPNNITVEYASNTGNADMVDGQHASAFMAAGTDNWVNTTGDTMTGRLEVTRILLNGWGESIKGILNTGDTGAGVYGMSNGPNSYGVAGGATGANGAGVYGETTGTSGIGVKGTAFGADGIGVYGEGQQWAGYFNGDLFAGGTVGIGTTNPTETKLHVAGNLKVTGDDGWSTTGDEAVIGLGNYIGHFFIKAVFGDGLRLGAYATTDAFVLKQISGNVGIGTASPASKLDVNGTTTTKVLVITGGADLSESFDVSPTGREIRPGAVVSINPDQTGGLMVSQEAYDHKVAGIISGAGDVKPGLHMGQKGTRADGEYPVALTGRVYCWADASRDPIRPGDLLTTSDTPGHVMRVTDYAKAQGATLGKAMSSLEQGQGLVLVLVGLQ